MRYFGVLALLAAFAFLGPLSIVSADAADNTFEASPSPDIPDAEVAPVIDIEKASRTHQPTQLEAASFYAAGAAHDLTRPLGVRTGPEPNPGTGEALRRGHVQLPHSYGVWPGD